jgi:hypothetical protein
MSTGLVRIENQREKREHASDDENGEQSRGHYTLLHRTLLSS